MNKQFITGIHAANRMWRYLGRGKPIKSLRYPQAVKVAVWEWGIMNEAEGRGQWQCLYIYINNNPTNDSLNLATGNLLVVGISISKKRIALRRDNRAPS